MISKLKEDGSIYVLGTIRFTVRSASFLTSTSKLLQFAKLLALKDTFHTQIREIGTLCALFPFQDGEIHLHSGSVGKHGGETSAEVSQRLKSSPKLFSRLLKHVTTLRDQVRILLHRLLS